MFHIEAGSCTEHRSTLYYVLCITAVDGDMTVNRICFIRSMIYKRAAAQLIASGPRGHIHYWNVFQGGCLYAQFPVVCCLLLLEGAGA